jgi:hypothetical protein
LVVRGDDLVSGLFHLLFIERTAQNVKQYREKVSLNSKWPPRPKPLELFDSKVSAWPFAVS